MLHGLLKATRMATLVLEEKKRRVMRFKEQKKGIVTTLKSKETKNVFSFSS